MSKVNGSQKNSMSELVGVPQPSLYKGLVYSKRVEPHVKFIRQTTFMLTRFIPQIDYVHRSRLSTVGGEKSSEEKTKLPFHKGMLKSNEPQKKENFNKKIMILSTNIDAALKQLKGPSSKEKITTKDIKYKKKDIQKEWEEVAGMRHEHWASNFSSKIEELEKKYLKLITIMNVALNDLLVLKKLKSKFNKKVLEMKKSCVANKNKFWKIKKLWYSFIYFLNAKIKPDNLKVSQKVIKDLDVLENKLSTYSKLKKDNDVSKGSAFTAELFGILEKKNTNQQRFNIYKQICEKKGPKKTHTFLSEVVAEKYPNIDTFLKYDVGDGISTSLQNIIYTKIIYPFI